MNNQEKIELLKRRLHNLEVNNKDNNGVQRRIRRDIRNLEKKILQNAGQAICE